jgi:hypothetical protein
MKITWPWLTCRFAQVLHVLTQPFIQIFSYSTDLANIPTPPHTHTHTRPTMYLSAHQMPAVASFFPPSKTTFPSTNQITHLPSYTLTCTYSVTHASSRLLTHLSRHTFLHWTNVVPQAPQYCLPLTLTHARAHTHEQPLNHSPIY